jgi:hypothetical protein
MSSAASLDRPHRYRKSTESPATRPTRAGLGDATAETSDAAYQRFPCGQDALGQTRRRACRPSSATTVARSSTTTTSRWAACPRRRTGSFSGSRSANEWTIYAYQFQVDKTSRIRSDPNDWSALRSASRATSWTYCSSCRRQQRPRVTRSSPAVAWRAGHGQGGPSGPAARSGNRS